MGIKEIVTALFGHKITKPEEAVSIVNATGLSAFTPATKQQSSSLLDKHMRDMAMAQMMVQNSSQGMLGGGGGYVQIGSAATYNNPFENITTATSLPLPLMSFRLREINNGYMVEVSNEEIFIKELTEVGGVILGQWAAKIMREQT